VFDSVLQLTSRIVPHTELRQHLAATQRRVEALYAKATPDVRAVLLGFDGAFIELGRSIDMGEGGDADALERARRRIGEIEEQLHEIETASAWPELAEACESEVHSATIWVGRLGSKAEHQSLEHLTQALERAFRNRDTAGTKRYLKQLEQLGNTCFARDEQAWPNQLDYLASRIEEAFDLRAASAALREGRTAQAAGNLEGIKSACMKLQKLLPSASKERARNLGSGVR
jgi:hypothetical protein